MIEIPLKENPNSKIDKQPSPLPRHYIKEIPSL